MSSKSILIVDDSTIIAERLQSMLRGLNNIDSITHAGDYTSALSMFSEASPNIVLLDINLPGKSGIALLRHIKDNFPSTIVIMITNQIDDYYRRICKMMGASYFIDKSKDFEQIPSIISSLP